jgi:multidrug efflux pump
MSGFAKFFIHHPVFAISLSLVILIAGGVSILALPQAQYPEITPPVVQVSTTYVGASADVVEANVAAPIETQVNGVDDMIYMQSTSTATGQYNLRVSFQVGTDPDIAAVNVQNRVQQAIGNIPVEVQNYGISVKKASPNMLVVITLYSPDNSYDTTFLSNYARINMIDALMRTPGIGDNLIVGQRDYSMRMWVRPDKLAKLGLTAGDVIDAVKDQNVQAPAGAIGQPPAKAGTEFQYTVNVKGRLTTVEEYENIVVRTQPDGSILRMRDVARVELGGQDYSSFGGRNGQPGVVILLYQAPDTNALDAAKRVRAKLEELAQTFPPGIKYDITLDNTLFITAALEDVLHTLFEAFGLVLIVVFVFLGSTRATLIPILAIPVSLVGTFASFAALGFSINTLTMFAMVLAIGIVVDDAIVVVEAAEHNIEQGLSSVEATDKAMEEVAGPVVAIAIVLSAVFVPVAFLGGITGQLYRQFAVTLSVSVLLSALVALTLTPALCAMLLRPRHRMRGPVGWFLRAFNRVFGWSTKGYVATVRGCIRAWPLMLGVLAGIATLAFVLLKVLPTSFVPAEDQGYFFANFALPDGASQERSRALADRAEKFLQGLPGVQTVTTLGGLDIITTVYNSNRFALVASLKPWEERKTPETQLNAIMAKAQREFGSYPEAIGLVFGPPAIPGIGQSGGFQFMVQDRGGQSDANQLAQVAQRVVAEAGQRRDLIGMYSPFRTTVPQLDVELDRDKIKTIGVPVSSVLQGLSAYLGGVIVNNFNLYGRVYKVMVQAEPEFRLTPDNIKNIYVANVEGQMVPLGTLAFVRSVTGPDLIQRYNVYRTAEVDGQAAPGFSSGQAIAAMEEVGKTLPPGYGYDWTGLAFQEKQAGAAQGLIFALALALVFLVLAALYESWGIPFSVMLGMPLAVFGAFGLIWLRGMINDVYVQVGLVTLIGLAAKNAILIVEFAKEKHEREALPIVEAALQAAQLRFRPILMTSFAFILGVVPLVLATGAGANSRHSLGTGVVGGMTFATALGVFFIPVLYTVIARLTERKGRAAAPQEAEEVPAPAREPAPVAAAGRSQFSARPDSSRRSEEPHP